MPICRYCGKEFDLKEARMYIGRRFGAGTYNEMYPDGDICLDCALDEMSSADAAWDEMVEFNPHLADDD